jgi:hypothetical protein
VRVSLRNWFILNVQYAQFKTAHRQACLDKDNNAIPWYTYPAIDYLKQFDFSAKAVFERGSGYSTRFWAERCKSLVSVEDNEEWFERIKDCLPENVQYQFLCTTEDYVNYIRCHDNQFDIIIIDGNHRYECAEAALEKLAENGMIILDNSNWEQNIADILRDSGLIEVDMSGFGPINPYTWTTSLFLTRSFDLTPVSSQPRHCPGAITRWNNRSL